MSALHPQVHALKAEIEGFLPQRQSGLTLPGFGEVLMLIVQSVYRFAQTIIAAPEFDTLAEQAIQAVLSLYDAWDIFPNSETVFERLMKDRGRLLLEQAIRDAFAFVRGVPNGLRRFEAAMDQPLSVPPKTY